MVGLVKVVFSTQAAATMSTKQQLVGMYVLSFTFAMCVHINLLACLWHAAGTLLTPGEAAMNGWMSQNYSAHPSFSYLL